MINHFKYSSILLILSSLSLLIGCSTDIMNGTEKNNLSDQYAFLKQSNSIHYGNTPKKLGLLLPSQGPYAEAAKTIRDGFLSGYYKANNQTFETKPAHVQVYDTSQSGGVIAAYQKALADGVSFIVGPLTKPEVQNLSELNLEIPVIALNSIGSQKNSSKLLYQFGLLPEDEVHAISQHAKKQGKNRALIIAPENDWGRRIVNAFRDSFVKTNGRVVATLYLNSEQDLSETLANALNTRFKNNRYDFDMIFLATHSDLGRQVKPLLNLHQKQNLSVYATSEIYSGKQTANLDQDLNGVRFCDMPWVLNNNEPLGVTQKLSNLVSKNVSRTPRYFALGLDAYQLANTLSGNSAVSLTHIQGVTGELTLDKNQRIHRQLVCARFEQGQPVPD